ncbi:hypothetical protein PP640_gp18 [Arthrobacter phage Faja]|uniref:Uncharacterized protein n=1 Tax=Arthrobacter phage Faja TaxID=2419957 RepID=A0A3G2KG59_9CAUD|nr:hypothetical protein PP640_gp18 [Arthrobacter phage Faja]AYN57948.1 hypothetical protein PBI_FAJA_18 [Arthrobacter phage Faja]
MTQQGEVVKKPGARLTVGGLVTAAVGLVLLVMNLATTHAKFVPGVGTVETQGTPSAASIILIVVGLILAGIGFARRMLAAAERR